MHHRPSSSSSSSVQTTGEIVSGKEYLVIIILTLPSHCPSPGRNQISMTMTTIIAQFSLSLLSALSSVFIIVTFFKFRRLHTFAYKVIMMLAVANLGLDCAYLIGEVAHDT